MAALLKLTGLSWRELVRAIWRGSVETNVTNRAAGLAFDSSWAFSPCFCPYRHGFDDWLGTGFARYPDAYGCSFRCFESGKTGACADDGQRKSLVFTPLRALVILVGDLRTY